MIVDLPAVEQVEGGRLPRSALFQRHPASFGCNHQAGSTAEITLHASDAPADAPKQEDAQVTAGEL